MVHAATGGSRGLAVEMSESCIAAARHGFESQKVNGGDEKSI